MSADRIWRVGVIGTGKHGSRYAQHIVYDVEGLELAAISRRSAEGRVQAQAWRCQYYADWREMVADPAVDCLVSALPPILNCEVAAACTAARSKLRLPLDFSTSTSSTLPEASMLTIRIVVP